MNGNCTCAPGTYVNSNILSITKCTNCPSVCLLCNSSTYCIKCTSNLVLINGYCIFCQNPCLTCISQDTTYCLSCQSGYFLFGSFCLKNCQNNQIAVNGVCICQSGLTFRDSCIDNCPIGYLNISSQCYQCDPSCLYCLINLTNCVVCNSGY